MEDALLINSSKNSERRSSASVSNSATPSLKPEEENTEYWDFAVGAWREDFDWDCEDPRVQQIYRWSFRWLEASIWKFKWKWNRRWNIYFLIGIFAKILQPVLSQFAKFANWVAIPIFCVAKILQKSFKNRILCKRFCNFLQKRNCKILQKVAKPLHCCKLSYMFCKFAKSCKICKGFAKITTSL